MPPASLRPNLVIDAHNWDGDDEYNADCVEVPREAATGLGKASHALQQRAVQDLAACGYPIHPTAWGADTDPRLAHRWFARQHVLSALVETHSGSPADVADFQRRQGMYAALIHGIVRHYAATYAAEKPRLDALEGSAPNTVREVSLFPVARENGSAALLPAGARPFLGLAVGDRGLRAGAVGNPPRRKRLPLPKREGWREDEWQVSSSGGDLLGAVLLCDVLLRPARPCNAPPCCALS